MAYRLTHHPYVMRQSLFDYLDLLPWFFSNVIIPFLFGVAFLFFVVNAIRFFVIESNNEDGQEKAKSLMLYGLAAFVFLIVFWGIVEVLTTSLGLYGEDAVCPDYLSGMPGSPCGNYR